MTNQSLSILIAEDDTYCRKGIETVLNETDRNTIIYQASNGLQALEMLDKHHIDILLTDINMQPINGLELSKEVRKKYPAIKIMAISGFITLEYIKPLRELNVEAIIYKNNGNTAEIETALKMVESGGKFLSANILEFVEQINQLSKQTTIRLTDDETNILKCLAEGMLVKDIPNKLFIGERTVNRRLEKLKVELGVTTGAALICNAKELNLI